jgi:hemerythrin superfamily protein
MAPIRPIINYRNAPSYYIAKITANWLKQNFELRFKYNVKNSIECAERIEELNIQPTYKMLTSNITNLYTNIPSNKTIDLLTTKLKDNACLDDITENEVIKLIKITVS